MGWRRKPCTRALTCCERGLDRVRVTFAFAHLQKCTAQNAAHVLHECVRLVSDLQQVPRWRAGHFFYLNAHHVTTRVFGLATDGPKAFKVLLANKVLCRTLDRFDVQLLFDVQRGASFVRGRVLGQVKRVTIALPQRVSLGVKALVDFV